MQDEPALHLQAPVARAAGLCPPPPVLVDFKVIDLSNRALSTFDNPLESGFDFVEKIGDD